MRILPLPPVPAVDVPAWGSPVATAWRDLGDRSHLLVRGIGTGGDFHLLLEEARALLLAGDDDAVLARLDQRRFPRAIVQLWDDEPDVAHTTMTPRLLALLAQRVPTRLTTLVLASLFFTHFDRLDGWHVGLFDATRELLRAAALAQPTSRANDLIETVRQADGELLELDGPERVAARLVAEGSDVLTWQRTTGLSPYTDGRFGRLLRDEFYLAQIRAADAGAAHHAFLAAVTHEVLLRAQTDTTYEDGMLFGHKVLTALTDTSTRSPSVTWLGAVLEIAGDPRLTQTAQWLTWWSRVPEANRQRAARWMRGVDLRAFFDGVERYAAETANEPLRRMMEPRRQFLLGLYEQDKVEDVRLVLGRDLERSVRASTRLPITDIARLDDAQKTDTAVVYVDCGTFSAVEGTHNFQLYLYAGGGPKALGDRKHRSFTGDQLRKIFPYRFVAAHGHEQFVSLYHQGFPWLQKALDFLASHAVELDERVMLSPENYAELQRRRRYEGRWY